MSKESIAHISYQHRILCLVALATLSLAGCGQAMMSRSLNDFEQAFDKRLQVKNESLLPAKFNVPYEARIDVQGGTPPYRWELIAGPLPQGLSLEPTAGTLSGTPVETGQHTVVIKVKDASKDPARSAVLRSFVISVE
jgi:hypothetical protein